MSYLDVDALIARLEKEHTHWESARDKHTRIIPDLPHNIFHFRVGAGKRVYAVRVVDWYWFSPNAHKIVRDGGWHHLQVLTQDFAGDRVWINVYPGDLWYSDQMTTLVWGFVDPRKQPGLHRLDLRSQMYLENMNMKLRKKNEAFTTDEGEHAGHNITIDNYRVDFDNGNPKTDFYCHDCHEPLTGEIVSKDAEHESNSTNA